MPSYRKGVEATKEIKTCHTDVKLNWELKMFKEIDVIMFLSPGTIEGIIELFRLKK